MNPIAAREPSTHPSRDRLEAELAAAAAHAAGPPAPEWDGYYQAKRRWQERPSGRPAEPGDLMGWWLPGEYPHGGDIRCRRCGAVSSMDGHPAGCPRTPCELGLPLLTGLRSCYCGQALVVTPETFGPCCENTPPVRVPGGCRWCGSGLCRVGDPGDLPEKYLNVPARFPQAGDAWVHPRCVDDSLLARAAACPHMDLAGQAAARRARRQLPLGVISP
ncbi:MAG: hypothetical protein ACRDRJ_21925 [Streptosporangiaceae bacterium]